MGNKILGSREEFCLGYCSSMRSLIWQIKKWIHGFKLEKQCIRKWGRDKTCWLNAKFTFVVAGPLTLQWWQKNDRIIHVSTYTDWEFTQKKRKKNFSTGSALVVLCPSGIIQRTVLYPRKLCEGKFGQRVLYPCVFTCIWKVIENYTRKWDQFAFWGGSLFNIIFLNKTFVMCNTILPQNGTGMYLWLSCNKKTW